MDWYCRWELHKLSHSFAVWDGHPNAEATLLKGTFVVVRNGRGGWRSTCNEHIHLNMYTTALLLIQKTVLMLTLHVTDENSPYLFASYSTIEVSLIFVEKKVTPRSIYWLFWSFQPYYIIFINCSGKKRRHLNMTTGQTPPADEDHMIWLKAATK